jgi:hypothetical protein
VADGGGADPRVERWKVERPSRTWDVADGATWWTTVDLVAGLEMDRFVAAARAELEVMRVGVALWHLTNERNLRRVLGGETSGAPYLVLAMHGDTGRLILAPGTPRPGFSFSMDEMRGILRVPGTVVVAVGCASGTREWADVFFAAGATDYIAPAGPPFAHAGTVFTALLFYGLTQGRDLAGAVETARAVDRELALWRHFRP